MKRQILWTLAVALGMSASAVPTQAAGTVFFTENFDSLTLGGSVNERLGTDLFTLEATAPGSLPVPGVYSAAGPAGWGVDNSLSTYDSAPTLTPGVPGTGVADYGVDEWEGWSFVNKDFWVLADDQDRSLFGSTTAASGTVAVADPDEYFDLEDGGTDNPVHGGYYSSSLNSPTFNVTAGGFYSVGFDSSWRAEAFDDETPTLIDLNNQAIEVIATFDAGSDVQVVKWNSDDLDAFYKPDNTDENFASDGSNLFFEAPAGATEASLEFRIANAGNDWWWAVDNIDVNDLIGGGNVLFEDFEGVTLGDSVNERLADGKVTTEKTGTTEILGTVYPTTSRPDSFTHTAPAGWVVDSTGTPALGDDDVGVFEFEQWSFMDSDFWTFADDQDRELFTKASGVFAVADSDEWDDLNDPGDFGDMTTLMQTPVIDITGLASDEELTLEFDSSWRAEGGQIASITALLDGVPVEILLWDGDSASSDFHASDTNESVSVTFDSAGASTLVLEFNYVGNNNWWWAVDNIQVSATAIPEPSSIAIVGVAVFGALVGRRRS